MYGLLSLLSGFLAGGAAGLGADAFDAREAASARLARAGALALPVLWQAEQSDDPEVRFRAQRLLAASRSARIVRRAGLLLRTHALVCCGRARELDAWQVVELIDGGPPLWEALDELVQAEWPEAGYSPWHYHLVSNFNPRGMIDHVNAVRRFARDTERK